MRPSTPREENALRVAIEVFHRSCQKLARHRNPNIYLKGNNELLSDWFTDGLNDLNPTSLGANEHPDYIMDTVGFELKSLNGRGQIQFNSTIPCGGYIHGEHEGECYYVIARYTKERKYGYLEDYTVVDGDYFNHDRRWAFSHVNTQETGFGNYGDGILRHRKMYMFPSPHREVLGVALISKFDNAIEFNDNLILERYIDRTDVNNHTFRFYVYRHKSLRI